MTTMIEDQGLASAVYTAVEHLNDAIMNAAKANLEVTIEEYERHSLIGVGPLVTAKVSKQFTR